MIGTFRGKIIDDMEKEELFEVIRFLIKDLQSFRNLPVDYNELIRRKINE